MKRMILVAVLILSSFHIKAQQTTNIDSYMNQAIEYYNRAQSAGSISDKIDYSDKALSIICPQLKTKMLFIQYASKVIPILEFNSESCITYLAEHTPNESIKKDLLYRIERDGKTLEYFIELDKAICFLWDSLTMEDVNYIYGRASYYAGQPYRDYLNAAGDKGRLFLQYNDK